MTRIACVGITVQDRIYSLPTLSEGGGKYQADRYLEIGGDPAATAAAAIVKPGMEVDFIGRIDDDSYKNTLLAELGGRGVDTALCRRHPHVCSSQSTVLVGQYDERIITNYPNPDLGTDTEWLEAIDFSRYDLILADVRWHSGTEKAFSLACLAGVATLLDADMTSQDVSPPIASADYTVFSTPGLKRVVSLQSPEEGLFQVTTQAAGKVYITLGSEGSLQIEDGHLCQRGAFSVDVVDTTGAGDVFHGTLTIALTGKMPAKEAICFASVVAAMRCTQPGGRADVSNRE